ncbi:hypothetical protein RE628_00940 [Paenibacillus sp. D2_2]|uniref:hypothetical protein n=1 Tax=Paenibacillus sp. D2_2 TaxID=3073092 RepID=UPI002814C189|nr:hypothetical protein [Paenibacillus sp. D2_2]WMT41216.1 hypothetical protein RE628_00940 [Paenibacillus sp. D2_2]
MVQSVHNETPALVQKFQQNTEVFNLLGYEVSIPKATGAYVSIRNEFQQLAQEAWNRMSWNFDTQYRSLDDLVCYGEDDADDIFDSACEYAINLLRSKGVYNINMNRFIEVSLGYIGYWETNFDDIQEELANALGNASTSAEVSRIKSEIFKDPETKRILCMSVYFDVFFFHRAVIECLNDSELLKIAESYTSSEQEEAMIIYSNIMNGSVRNEDLGRMIIEILKKYPFELDFYELALKYTSEEVHYGLIDYARYFNMPIDELIQNLHTDAENRERLADFFGEFTVELENRLQYNNLFQSIKFELPEDPIRAIQKVFFSLQNESIISYVFLLQGDLDERAAKKLENVKGSYAPIQDENPILLFDNTAFGSAKDGFLITDQRIYVHNMLEKEWSSDLQEIQEMYLSDNLMYIDGKSVGINLISSKDRDDFYEFVELLLFVLKYNDRIGINNRYLDYNWTPSAEQSMNYEVMGTVSTTSNWVMNTDEVIEDIKNRVLGIRNVDIRKYVFIENENEKVIKKFQNALESYANLEFDERPVVLFDNTVFGSAKDGCLITNRRIYIHNMLQKPVSIDIRSIISVELKDTDLLINQYAVGINMISSSDRAEFKAHMEDYINRLK